MREATVELETALEYCKAILNAESEEEILVIKNEITNAMRTNEVDEQYIEQYITKLEFLVDEVEKGNYILTETGLVKNDVEETVEVVETNPPEPTNIESQANTKAGLALGLAGAVIVTCIALKKKLLNQKKNENEDSFHR